MAQENEWSDLREFVDWLETSPPYEAVGRVIVQGARLTLGLLELCVAAGAERAEVPKWGATQSIKYLRKKDFDGELLDECDAALKNRNALAHGVWFNAFGRGQAFLKHDRDLGGFSGPLINEAVLEEWSRTLLRLADLVENKAR